MAILIDGMGTRSAVRDKVNATVVIKVGTHDRGQISWRSIAIVLEVGRLPTSGPSLEHLRSQSLAFTAASDA